MAAAAEIATADVPLATKRRKSFAVEHHLTHGFRHISPAFERKRGFFFRIISGQTQHTLENPVFPRIFAVLYRQMKVI